jgi:2-polyprenyl-3-methyl-5-hydroxy-6-metoxy-1,4-benzoquinol methylase
MKAAFKYNQFDPAPDSSHNLVVGFVPAGARVLEFGCATGYMSKVLKARLGCAVTGVELSAEAGELAREYCECVIIGDAEKLPFEPLLGPTRFDAILFADVLEHLREPGILLGRLRPFLAEGGAVIASIPNVAHGSVRLALLNGEFRYRPTGLLDNTHLRFFTRESIEDLFEQAGYRVTHWRRRLVDIERTEIGLPTRPVPDPVRKWIAADREATTYQFVVRAVRTDGVEILRLVSDATDAE